jgi:ferredoxin
VSPTRMTVRVDEAKCCGFGNCWMSTPEVFTIDDDGVAHATEGPIPVELEDKVRYAQVRCPQSAIEISETTAS